MNVMKILIVSGKPPMPLKDEFPIGTFAWSRLPFDQDFGSIAPKAGASLEI